MIQTIGRAARHEKGHAILYADSITTHTKDTRRNCRRRKIQEKFNKKIKASRNLQTNYRYLEGSKLSSKTIHKKGRRQT